jgi:hypothetical protein
MKSFAKTRELNRRIIATQTQASAMHDICRKFR